MTTVSDPVLPRRRAAALALAVAGAMGLSACANNGAYGTPDGGVASPGLGTAAGAAAGGVLGRVAAGSHNNTAAIVGGAVLGGIAGNMLVDRPTEIRRQEEDDARRRAEADEDMQRRLEYERLSREQQERLDREAAERRQYEEWRANRGAGGGYAAAPAADPYGANRYAAGPADTQTAQRLLTALGYYRGPIDGVDGPKTRSAVMQFESAQGLPRTGVVTPALVQRMRDTI